MSFTMRSWRSGRRERRRSMLRYFVAGNVWLLAAFVLIVGCDSSGGQGYWSFFGRSKVAGELYLLVVVAARAAGVRLDLDEIAAAVRRREESGAFLLVEGVGGLLCPLTEDGTVADLVALLGLPLLIVARMSLGTLNHTLLTVEAARRRGLAVAGVVVSE